MNCPITASLDLVPFFAPFYMMFFGFSLGDAGYGLLIILAAGIRQAQVAGIQRHPYAGAVSRWCYGHLWYTYRYFLWNQLIDLEKLDG
jgi:uncharacterized membrane protein